MLIGNTYPSSLIRRPALFTPVSVEEAQELLASRDSDSFWGHSNTVALASDVLGVDLTPREERPTLTLSDNNLPVLHGVEHLEVLVVSANIKAGHRKPRSDKSEYLPEDIESWQVLLVRFI